MSIIMREEEDLLGRRLISDNNYYGSSYCKSN